MPRCSYFACACVRRRRRRRFSASETLPRLRRQLGRRAYRRGNPMFACSSVNCLRTTFWLLVLKIFIFCLFYVCCLSFVFTVIRCLSFTLPLCLSFMFKPFKICDSLFISFLHVPGQRKEHCACPGQSTGFYSQRTNLRNRTICYIQRLSCRNNLGYGSHLLVGSGEAQGSAVASPAKSGRSIGSQHSRQQLVLARGIFV